jgi:hypothetical protein
MISCWPIDASWSGNEGESSQMSSGTVAMRLNVMELGRFTRCPSRELGLSSLLEHYFEALVSDSAQNGEADDSAARLFPKREIVASV